ncbi:hypothetical protein [Dyadobacter aurulentus]|uniref:hypothetical protein n=1 Tax=Dyadobacter sp. UC 10 TaxID=2605428 RepID=UPI0011F29054|nr:hypothetical protein [Dyadobacter sp. UC 10]KAA0992770.1 hypothetical protein FXO21_22625 [Dyadobacter sp. UC 10]
MAKPKKYPKSPKQSASLQTWENYKAKCAAVDKHNSQIVADKKKKEAVKKQVQQMKSKRK